MADARINLAMIEADLWAAFHGNIAGHNNELKIALLLALKMRGSTTVDREAQSEIIGHASGLLQIPQKTVTQELNHILNG